MKQFAILITLVFASQWLNAYQLDIGLQHNSKREEIDIDNASDKDIKTNSNLLGASFYFSDVSIAVGPWREAAFLSKTSSISLAVFDGEYTREDDCCSEALYDADTEGRDVQVRAVVNDFVIELESSKRKYKGKRSTVFTYADFEEKTNTLSVGHYIGDNQQWYGLLFKGEDDKEDDVKGLGGGYQAVFTLEAGRFISVDAALKVGSVDDDDNDDKGFTTFSADLAYFLNQQLSLDLTLLNDRGWIETDGPDQQWVHAQYLLGATYFPVAAFYVYGQLGVQVSEYDNYFPGNADAEGAGGILIIGLGGRF